MMRTLGLSPASCALLLSVVPPSHAHADSRTRGDQGGDGPIRHVLLISVDGMHAIDFANCAAGISGANHGVPYCRNLAHLGQYGVTYPNASASKPADSFPGLLAMVTGGSPRSTGVFYDVSYDRVLSPPAKTTPGDIPGGANLCPGVRGTPVGYDEFIDVDFTRLDGGGGIDPISCPAILRTDASPCILIGSSG